MPLSCTQRDATAKRSGWRAGAIVVARASMASARPRRHRPVYDRHRRLAMKMNGPRHAIVSARTNQITIETGVTSPTHGGRGAHGVGHNGIARFALNLISRARPSVPAGIAGNSPLADFRRRKDSTPEPQHGKIPVAETAQSCSLGNQRIRCGAYFPESRNRSRGRGTPIWR
jgi:hypothetical protein